MKLDFDYVILQNEYRKLNKYQMNVFPKEWYNIRDYDLKKKILHECIENHILIIESSNYYYFRKKALNLKKDRFIEKKIIY